MKYLSMMICAVLFVLISTACSALNPFHRDAETVKLGPDQWSSLVVYFKKGITHEQVSSFNHSVIYQMRSDGRGEEYKEGIGHSFAFEANGYRGFTITFYIKTTDEQRATIIESIKSNELVFKVFENIAPNDIKETDL